jgi:hypothetical protein
MVSRDSKKVRHDLKNALNALEIVVDLLKKDFDFKSEDGLEMIREAESSLKLIRDQMDSQFENTTGES